MPPLRLAYKICQEHANLPFRSLPALLLLCFLFFGSEVDALCSLMLVGWLVCTFVKWYILLTLLFFCLLVCFISHFWHVPRARIKCRLILTGIVLTTSG